MKTAPTRPALQKSLAATLFACGYFALSAPSQGQVLFEDELNSGDAWSLVHEADPSDNFVTFGFDYSALGIPEAPNTKPGDVPTSGVQMISNRDFGVTNSVAAFPTGRNFTGQYTFQFDLWMNAVGPFPLGGTGSTEFGGGAVGFDNNSTTPLSGGTLLVSGEGGSSSDWRLYGDDEFQAYTTHIDPETNVNDLYAPEMPSANASPNEYLGPIFPGKTAPDAQLNPNPPVNGLDQSGTLVDGTLGFRWSTFKFTVDTVAGTALVQVINPETSETANIGTFTLENTYVNRDTIDEKFITSLEGNVAITYRDLFPSLIDFDPSQGIDLTPYSFGVFDNVIVEAVVDTGLDGDYNDDGRVDSIDYAVWREGLGGEFDSTDFTTWLDNYGATTPPGTIATPEPAALGLVLASLSTLAAAARRSV